MLGILKSIRESLGKGAGDTVEVALVRDKAPREVDVPADLSAALEREPGAAAAFEALSYSHRREYVRWVEEAKRPETRQRRIAGTLERLASAGK